MSVEDKRQSPLSWKVAVEPPSIPLYVAGLLVSLAGILAVTTSINDPVLTATTLSLTIIGFIFSVGCRYLRLNLHLAELLIIVAIGYGIRDVTSVGFDWLAFVSQDQNQINIAAFMAWTLTFWAWTAVTDGILMFSALYAIASIGLISSSPQASPFLPTCFTVLLGSSLFLLAHHQGLRWRSHAVHESRPREMKMVSTQLGAAFIGVTIVFCLAALLVVPVNVMSGQVTLRQALRGLTQFAGINAPKPRGLMVADSADMQIGTGDGWDQSTDLVADIFVGDKQPHYWRCRTYDRYTGSGWTSTADGINHVMRPKPADAAGNVAYVASNSQSEPQEQKLPLITAQVHVLGTTTELLYPGEPMEVRLNHGLSAGLEQCPDGHIDEVNHNVINFDYAVDSEARPEPDSADMAAKLRVCDDKYPADISATYIGGIDDNDVTTPDDVSYFHQTVASVIGALPANRRTEFDKALALRDYVAHRCTYSLNVAALAPGTDHVRQFLETTRMGYCDLFASSMAVLCRTAGLPARLVTGFAPGAQVKDHYILHVNDKHAWVEIYFNGYGWLEFDPTAGSAVDSGPKAGVQNVKRTNPFLAYVMAHGLFATSLQLGIVLIFFYIIKVEIIDGILSRRKSSGRSSPSSASSADAVVREYNRMLRCASILGIVRKRHETPYEFAARAVSYLEQLQGDLSENLEIDAITDITRRFVAVRYGSDASRDLATAEHDDALLRFLQAAARVRLRLILRRVFRRKGSSLQAAQS